MTTTTLAQDRFGHPIQGAMAQGTVQNVAFTNLAAGTTGFFANDTSVVRVVSTVDAYILFSTAGTAPTSGTGTFLPAGRPEYFRIDQTGTIKLSALGASASGTISCTEMS